VTESEERRFVEARTLLVKKSAFDHCIVNYNSYLAVDNTVIN